MVKGETMKVIVDLSIQKEPKKQLIQRLGKARAEAFREIIEIATRKEPRV